MVVGEERDSIGRAPAHSVCYGGGTAKAANRGAREGSAEADRTRLLHDTVGGPARRGSLAELESTDLVPVRLHQPHVPIGTNGDAYRP